MQSAIQFVVDGVVKPADQATLAAITDVVEVRAVGNQMKSVRISVKSVPPTSAVPIGTIGLTQTGTLITIDQAGGYLIALEAKDAEGRVQTTEKSILVPESSGRIIPPFSAKPAALNLAGQEEGWHPFLRAWLKDFDAFAGGGVPNTRTVTAQAPLTGGGNLGTNISIGLGVIGDSNHGSRSGGTLHANVVAGGSAGFMSGADKTKLDLISGAIFATGIQPVGTANVDGAATLLARGDHVHAHGNQAGGALHAAVVAGGANGFMTGTDKTKLDGLGMTLLGAFRIEATAPFGITGTTPVDILTPLSLGSLVTNDVIDVSSIVSRSGTTADLINVEITSSATAGAGTIYSTLPVFSTGSAAGVPNLFTVVTPGTYYVHLLAYKGNVGNANFNVSQRRLTAKVFR